MLSADSLAVAVPSREFAFPEFPFPSLDRLRRFFFFFIPRPPSSTNDALETFHPGLVNPFGRSTKIRDRYYCAAPVADKINEQTTFTHYFFVHQINIRRISDTSQSRVNHARGQIIFERSSGYFGRSKVTEADCNGSGVTRYG